jgi:hypothetical protein
MIRRILKCSCDGWELVGGLRLSVERRKIKWEINKRGFRLS